MKGLLRKVFFSSSEKFVSALKAGYAAVLPERYDARGIRSMRRSGYISKSPITLDGEEWRGKGKAVISIHGLNHLLRKSRSEEGNSLVEFALVAAVFFYLVFATFDFGHLYFVRMKAENAIQEAARFGSTGNHLPDPVDATKNLTRVDSIISTLESDASGLNLSNIQVSSLKGGANSGGGPRDMMTVAATVTMPLMTPMIAALFPGGKYTFTTSITIMNEPFLDSQTE